MKARFGTDILDSWAWHCATRIGKLKRKLVPDGSMVFGSRGDLERRQQGLIDNATWKERRLLPFVSYGDRQKVRGNQNVHLIDDRTVKLKISRRPAGRTGSVRTDALNLDLVQMTGNVGELMRQLAQICAEPLEADRINVSYSIDEKHVSITIDPEDMPNHPERRRPIVTMPGRAVGVDLNPSCIGLAVVESTVDPEELEETRLLDYLLLETALPKDASTELTREVLARVCHRAIGLARKHHAGLIVVESGLGKLRSGGKNRSLNRTINYWARTVFLSMLRRKAKLAGIEVVEVWAGYSTTIGNLAFEAPDACASAAEIARRGIARSCGVKELLPAMVDELVLRRWKDEDLPNAHRQMLRRSPTWGEMHRGLKTAKLGVRRPHPRRFDAAGLDDRASLLGHAVRRLGHRHRPGWIFRLEPAAVSEATG